MTDNRNTHTIHDENVDRLVSVLERIAAALEGKNAPVILSFPQDFTPEDRHEDRRGAQGGSR